MIIYWISCLLSMIMVHQIHKVKIIVPRIRCSRANHRDSERVSWTEAFLCSLPLLIISSMRCGIGSDDISYREIYGLIGPTMQNDHKYEIFFSYLVMILNRLGSNYQGFIVVTSFIFLTLIFKTILDESTMPAMSIFLLLGMAYYFQSMNIIRQITACAICFFSIRFIKEGKLIKFAVCVLIASGFHMVALIFMPAYFIYRKRFSTKFLIGVLVMFIPCIEMFSNMIARLVIYLGTRLNNGYYLVYFENFNGVRKVGIFSLLINLCIFVWTSLYLDRKDPENNGLLNLQYIAVVLSVLNGALPQINRFRFMYGIFSLLLIPKAIMSQKDNRFNKYISLAAISVMFLIYSLYIEGYMNQSGVVPYISILGKG